MSDGLPRGVADLVEARRLSQGDATKRRFSVSRQAALERMRRRPLDDPWDWLLGMVRAAKLSSAAAAARVRRYDDPGDDGNIVTEVTFVVPDADFEGLVLDDLLDAALGGSQSTPDGVEESALSDRHRRWRQLVGESLNLALGLGPVALELRTPVGGLAFRPGGDRSVVRGRALSGEGDSSFVVRVSTEKPSIGSLVGRWFSGKDDFQVHLARRWASVIVGARDPRSFDLSKGMPLGVQLPQFEFELGQHAHMGWTPGEDGEPLDQGLWLVREGVRVASLDSLIVDGQLNRGLLRGWVDCPTLELTADDSAVVKNAAYDLLLSWLREYSARVQTQGTHNPHWPASLERIHMASGREVLPEDLVAWESHQHELVYVYRGSPAEARVPSRLKSRIAALWPSQVEALRRDYPGIRPLPLRALGSSPDLERTDLSSLEQGSLETLRIANDVPLELEGSRGTWSLLMDVVAYVHRYPHATAGTVVVLAYDRRMAQLRDPAMTVPGVTLLCRVRSPGEEAFDVGALRADALVTAALATRAKEIAEQHRESLLAHVMGRRNPWDIPFLRIALEDMNALSLNLRYVDSNAGLQLAWRDSVLLDVFVATTMEGESRTLRHLLERLRDAGLVVVAQKGSRWKTLESEDGDLRPWVLESSTRELVERVVGVDALLHMPAVPEVHPLVRPAEQQRALIRAANALDRDIERITHDADSRARLIGHLLVARALGESSHGLETLPLFLRYDPRALSPTRWVSLESLLDEVPAPGLVPTGAVGRSLPAPVVEVPPGVARLLEREGLAPVVAEEAGAVTQAKAGRSIIAPIRKRARVARPLLRQSVVHAFAVGSLQVAGDGSSQGIALWSRGLRVGEVELPEPLGRVSGRLWLTQTGQRSSRAQLQAAILGLARNLLGQALYQQTLLSPRSKRRERLGHFINYARSIVLHDDPHDLRSLLGLRGESRRGAGRTTAQLLALTDEAQPLTPLPDAPAARFASLLRQSLALPLHIDTATLSWRVLAVEGRRNDGAYRVDLGRRSEWIQEALRGRAGAEFQTAVLAIAHFHRDAAARELLHTDPEYRAVAYLRLLKLSAASAGPPRPSGRSQ